MRGQGVDDAATRDFIARGMELPTPEQAGRRRRTSSRRGTRVTTSDRLAGFFGSAVGMLPIAAARSLELFTEITDDDESACDAWVGRIRCGDTDRVTLVPGLVLTTEISGTWRGRPSSR